MQANSPPAKIPTPFALTGLKNAIPETAAGITDPGQASMATGFPALTMNPVQAGGVPPFGKDFNGILFLLSAMNQWESAGGFFQYDSAFATDASVGGYPKGAVLLKATQVGFWRNTVDNNTTNPDTGGAGWVDFFSGYAATGGPVSQFANDAGYLVGGSFGASLATNGWQILPSGRIEQWGYISGMVSDSPVTVTLPRAFPNAHLNSSATIRFNGSVGGSYSAYAFNTSLTQITVTADVSSGSASGLEVFWQAIGY